METWGKVKELNKWGKDTEKNKERLEILVCHVTVVSSNNI